MKNRRKFVTVRNMNMSREQGTKRETGNQAISKKLDEEQEV